MSSGSNETLRHDLPVGVDLDDAEHLDEKSPGLWSRIDKRDTSKGEALSSGRNDG